MEKSVNSTNCTAPIPASEVPTFQPFEGKPPLLPKFWACTAILQPFSPLQSNSTSQDKESPFFEICLANVYLVDLKSEILGINGMAMFIVLSGSSGRTWRYLIDSNNFTFEIKGSYPNITREKIDFGWTLPTPNWFGDKLDQAVCSGTSPLNWMNTQNVNWWKIPVGDTTPPPATWMWFDANTNFPVRLMFGQGPVNGSTNGDPTQLALFQMYSFTYFPRFEQVEGTFNLEDIFAAPTLPSFQFGNPNNYELFTWNSNFGMTVFMTPVNEKFNPLPTRVLYVWKPDDEYHVSSDRSQSTLMNYNYNPDNSFTSQVALLTGAAPNSVNPPPINSGTGFLIDYDKEKVQNCIGHSDFPFPQQPPTWIQIQEVEGTIQATLTDYPVLCPNETVTIISVLFPPSLPNYPDSTYLWTWYSPLNESGSSSRPITFMQSQSGVNVGISLALADYFYYKEFTKPIEPCNFDVPPKCDENGSL